MTDDGQQQLVAGSVDTEGISGTVWVVTARKDGCPHSYVEAVYENEAAAIEHKLHLADNSFRERAIAWGVHEREIKASFTRGDER